MNTRGLTRSLLCERDDSPDTLSNGNVNRFRWCGVGYHAISRFQELTVCIKIKNGKKD